MDKIDELAAGQSVIEAAQLVTVWMLVWYTTSVTTDPLAAPAAPTAPAAPKVPLNGGRPDGEGGRAEPLPTTVKPRAGAPVGEAVAGR